MASVAGASKRKPKQTFNRSRPPSSGHHLALYVLSGVIGSLVAYAVWKSLTDHVDEEREELPADQMKPEPDSITQEKSSAGLQSSEEGSGPYYHRHYVLPIQHSKVNPADLMELIRRNINECSPQLMARFEKTKSTSKSPNPGFEVGDEFQIHITGPWNGPVRVSESNEDSFTFVTKEGHFEAGGIRFRAREASKSPASLDSAETPSASENRLGGASKSVTKDATGQYDLVFEIESWSRSSDGIVDLVYDKIPAARFAQTQMWAKFCESAAELSGGKSVGNVQIKTQKAKP